MIFEYMSDEEILAQLRTAQVMEERISEAEYEILLGRYESLINEKYQLEMSLQGMTAEHE